MPIFDDSLVRYELNVDFDDIPVRGNAVCSGDDDLDASVEQEIYDRLVGGDVWAWASVQVTAYYDGIDHVVGQDFLGCCCYDDEEDFKACGYYDDMKDRAREDLYMQIESILARFGCIDPANTPGCTD